MTSKYELIEDLLVAHPDISEAMAELTEEWAPEPAPLCGALIAIVWWIEARAKEGMLDFNRIAEIVEQALAGDDPETRDAVAQCFVETLANISYRLPAPAYESALGPTAQGIAREWLAF